ncbi:MAG: TIGR03960 family B12-binding radical SAM protein [Desulfovibrio sp.]|jgi:radical SAM family uncharacterized protein/radical SAM-linked protein|nr:TIGR03960 family B12-binding radical SAM protein [Desulfovibrio sp.]
MRNLLPLLPRPSRYAGIENGAVVKDPGKVRLHVAFAYPDTYEVGMSYLGQKILYGIVNDVDRWWAERVMAPDVDAAEILRRHGAPLCTLESDTPLGKLDCLAFSMTHELACTNVLLMLDLAGIPLRTADRSQDLAACPLVVTGGGALPSAEHLAPFMDLMVLGDGERAIVDLLALLERRKAAGGTRNALLEEAAGIPGVYVPSLFKPGPDGVPVPIRKGLPRPTRRIVPDLDEAPYPTQQVTPLGTVHNRLSIEIARGCTRGCRFCHAGMVYRPVRERTPQEIAILLRQCLRNTGFDEISFLSLSAGDYSALKTVCLAAMDRCSREQVALSLPSLRVGTIDDGIMELMADIRRTGVTLAPEAGTARLRDVINKGVTEEELLLHCEKLLEHGWRQVKLYFMIGLPTETDEDLAAIADLCRKVRDVAGRGGPKLQVTASLSPFVPKPFTPFQWEAQIGLAEMRRRIDVVLDTFRGQKMLKPRWHDPEASHLEGILSRADRRLADVVESAYRKGAVFCSWAESFTLAPWLEAMKEAGLDPDAYTGARDVDGPLPWDHLEAGIDTDFLRRERKKALAGKTTRDCRDGTCNKCGACDTPAGPSRLVSEGPCVMRVALRKRDQEAHGPGRDEEGRLVCRPGGKPPQIAPHLTAKAVMYRVWHTKTGGCAYLSQLELQQVLDRALRRAGIPMAFSQGFHPLPLVSFGRALPVGVESRAEWFSITLHRAVIAKDVSEALGPCLPPGMDVLKVEFVDNVRRNEQSIAETFLVAMSTAEDNARAAELFAAFAAASGHPYLQTTKHGFRSVDIRPLLKSWDTVDAATEPGDREGRLVTFVADWVKGYLSPLALCLEVLKDMGDEATLKAKLSLTKTSQIFASGVRP